MDPRTRVPRLTLLSLGIILAVLALLAWSEAHAAPTSPATLQLAAQPYMAPLRRETQRVWGLQGPVATMAAQLQQESRWRADAQSPVGAVGLAQFMPSTARWIGGLDPELAERAPLNPVWAIRAVVVYDQWLYKRVRLTDATAPGASCQRMAYALAAYNGGLGWVYKRQALSPQPDVCLGATCAINPGVTPASQRENERYPLVITQGEAAFTRWGAGACT